MNELPDIYADFNGIGRVADEPSCLGVELDTLGTLTDLTNAGIRLRDGVRLTIWDGSDEAEDLEADTVVVFDEARAVWLATFPEGDLRYVPRKDRQRGSQFLCLGCRSDLAERLAALRTVTGSRGGCPHCGTPIDAAIAPPQTGQTRSD